MTPEEKSYIAGFCDGDGCICIGKCRNDGFQLKFEITQCNLDFLQKIDILMESKGKFYADKRKGKYTAEKASSLRICGKKSMPLLILMRDFAVIKSEQAKLALNYLPLIKKHGMHEERKVFYEKMQLLNEDKTAYEKDYSKINDAYIAGLFDAEGNVHLNPECKSYYVKITQKSDPILLVHIQEHLTFGNIVQSENYRIRFYSRANILAFHERVKQYLRIKHIPYDRLLKWFVNNPLLEDVLLKQLENLSI